MDRQSQCQKCARSGAVTVALDFKPGGTQALRLCHDHVWELYLTIVRWYSDSSAPDEQQVPEYDRRAL